MKDKFQLTCTSWTSDSQYLNVIGVKDLDNIQPESLFLTQEALNKTQKLYLPEISTQSIRVCELAQLEKGQLVHLLNLEFQKISKKKKF